LSLDVNVNVSKPEVIETTDLSVLLFVSSTGPFSQGAGRVAFYTSLSAVEDEFAVGTAAYTAATFFFSQNPHPEIFAIGQVFDSPVAGFMETGALGALANFQAISDGSFGISIDGDFQSITGLDFTLDASLSDVATTIETALQAIGTGGYTAATVVLSSDGTQFIFTSGTTGDGSTVSALSTIVIGTDISGVGLLNAQDGTAVTVDGYTPTTFTNELDLIQQAAACSGQFIFGWVLDATYRDAQESLDAAAWAESNSQYVILGLCSNNPLAWDAASTTDIGYVLSQLDYTRTNVTWLNTVADYPEVSMLAAMLAVNYALANSTRTAKFLQLPGVTPANINQTQLTVLDSKRYNTYTQMTNAVAVYREGVQCAENWYIDDWVNLANFGQELKVDVYNVFLTNKKVPYTAPGVLLLVGAIQPVCDIYVSNGTFADRVESDSSSPSGDITIPAYQIIPTPLQDVTIAERAARTGPPIQIIGQLSDAIHSVVVNVEAFD
jgi:hypothetical protein